MKKGIIIIGILAIIVVAYFLMRKPKVPINLTQATDPERKLINEELIKAGAYVDGFGNVATGHLAPEVIISALEEAGTELNSTQKEAIYATSGRG